MGAPRTLWLYIAREVLLHTLLGVLAITMVLVTNQLMRWVGDLIGAGFRFQDVIAVLRIFSTLLIIYALPISFLFGVLLAFGRMSADVEVVAMRSCGMSLLGLLTPVLALSTLTAALLYPIAIDIEPAARREVRTAAARLLMRGAALEPGTFTQLVNRVVYVTDRSEGGEFLGVLIADRSDPKRSLTIFAKRGAIVLDEQRLELTLELEDGQIHVDLPDSDDDRYQHIAFDRFDYEIDIKAMLGPREFKRAKEMAMDELRETAARVEAGDPGPYRERSTEMYAVHISRRLATPLAPILFGLVAVPVGMQRRRGARSWGMLLCAVLTFGYYALQALSEVFAKEGLLPPRVAPWLPNLCYSVVAVVLLIRARRIS